MDATHRVNSDPVAGSYTFLEVEFDKTLHTNAVADLGSAAETLVVFVPIASE
jgi:hypothetical protein